MQKMETYLQEREDLVSRIQDMKYDDLLFTKEEEKANTVYRTVISSLRKNTHPSFYRGNSMKHRAIIDQSDLFKIIKKMPKGAILHLHVDCAIDPEFFLEIAYNENVYIHEETRNMIYRKTPPFDPKFQKMIEKRNASGNPGKFDKDLKDSISIGSEEFEKGNNIWESFMEKIMQTNPVIYYHENFKKYLVNVFKNFIEEGILHIEARALLGSVLDEEGKALSYEEELDIYRAALSDIQKIEPDFTFRIICQGLKCWDLETIDQYLRDVIRLKKNHGDLIVGFDLVQEEDKFKTMVNLSKVLLRKEEYEKKSGVELPFVLHGGESLNLSTESLFDLILLKTKRIGHGLNLIKHSYLMDIIKKEKIGIEVCPFSNQILGYVEDLRLHPAITFLNYGLKVTISPDDPGFFRNRYINYDFFFCSAAMEFDLKDLKRVIINSIECSLLVEGEKKKHLITFNKKWKVFIEEFLKVYHNYANRKSIVGGESFEIQVNK